MKLENVTVVLEEYLEGKKALKPLLPIASKLLVICVALLFVDNFIDLPSEINACAYILTWVTCVLTLARGEFFMLTLGLFLRFADYTYTLLYFLIRWRELSGSTVIYAVFYGALLLMAYKKSKELGLVPDKIEKKVTEVSGKAQATYNNVSSSVKANVDDVMTLRHDEEAKEDIPAETPKGESSPAAEVSEKAPEE